jgi:starch phosphorylase
MTDDGTVAYFSMEIALEGGIPTYSGGLGVLAGDYLRSCADLGLPVVGLSLLYHGGYFRQHVDASGQQSEEPVDWWPGDRLERAAETVSVPVGGRDVCVGVWRLDLVGASGQAVPVYLLDTDLEENDAEARAICDQLYSGDDRHRLEQEAVLGLGGVAMLERLGRHPATYHLNEGHSALLVLRLLDEEPLEQVRARCAFTTHTPVPAGHDRFSADVVEDVLGPERGAQLTELGLLGTGELNMTELGIAGASFVNAVSRRHAEVTRKMFPGVSIRSVTNGVHATTWVAPSMASLFDEHCGGWRRENALLRYAGAIPTDEIGTAHAKEKRRLFDHIALRTGTSLDPSMLTIGIARRSTPYKQTTLLFSDIDRLEQMAAGCGGIQVLFAGKAHPRDLQGKRLIERVVEAGDQLEGSVSVLFLEDYDLHLAALLVAGSDIWLNTPIKPNEASGTSGMKAALNGVPSLSVLDGWWIEGCIEGITGWAVGGLGEGDDAADLYAALESSVLPVYYKDEARFNEIRRFAIALNGSFFTTERVAREYAQAAYRLT